MPQGIYSYLLLERWNEVICCPVSDLELGQSDILEGQNNIRETLIYKILSNQEARQLDCQTDVCFVAESLGCSSL